MFCLAIDSKLRASDLVALTVGDIAESDVAGYKIKPRAKIVQRKTGTEVAFEISADTAACLSSRLFESGKLALDRLFTMR